MQLNLNRYPPGTILSIELIVPIIALQFQHVSVYTLIFYSFDTLDSSVAVNTSRDLAYDSLKYSGKF
jgi:hypothetical protein